jgi:hypothetical protein
MKKMKRKQLLLSAFLLMLFIGPSIFAMTSTSLPILAGPNMTKEFSLSDGESWLIGWDFRREISISDTYDWTAGTNYQLFLNVTYDSDMQIDFDDIRYTDNDGITLLDYWLETYTASIFAIFWVEVKDDIDDGDVSIYMYYGNSTVSTTSNGTATFIFYEDWSTQSIDPAKWDVEGTATVTYSATDATHGYVQKLDVTSANVDYSETTDTLHTTPVAIVGRMKIPSLLADYQRSAWGYNTRKTQGYPTVSIFSLPSSVLFYTYDDDMNYDSDALGAGYTDAYYRFQITINSDGECKIYQGDTLKDTIENPPITNNVGVIGIYLRDSEYDYYSDWTFARKFIPPESGEAIGTILDEEAYEDYLPPHWNEIGIAILRFIIPLDTWALDMFLIILGLCMIPSSTVYLAYSYRHGINSDKVYYALIAFMLGWAFFFGGIFAG